MSERARSEATKKRASNPPRNDRHAQKRAQDAKDERHDAPAREAVRQPSRRRRHARQVQKVLIVAGRVADGGDALRLAGVVVVLGDGEGGLQDVGGFDEGGDEAGGDVPFDVAMEEPDAWRRGC